jgi:hypothetical protein
MKLERGPAEERGGDGDGDVDGDGALERIPLGMLDGRSSKDDGGKPERLRLPLLCGGDDGGWNKVSN